MRLGQRTAATGSPPLWAHLGYLHQLAASAAVLTGLDFRWRVAVWRGMVMLPGLGLADVQSRREWDFAQVDGEEGYVLIRGPASSVQLPENHADDGDGWWGLRTIRLDGCDLWLDDLDPYREFDGPVPPRRLNARETQRWEESINGTWQLLTQHHPATAAELAAGLTTLVPRAAMDQSTPYSASHNDAFGSVVLSLPPDPTTFAATLVHELQHSKFGILLALVDLLDPRGDNDAPRLYAPWRDDPRPATAVLHGLFSFLAVTAFYHEHLSVVSDEAARAAQFEFAYYREQTLRAANTLLTDAALSVLGKRFLTTTRNRLLEWDKELLPEAVRAAADRANADHYLTWRLRHLRPPEELVTKLAQAWLRNRPRPSGQATANLKPSTGSPHHARLTLTRIWLTDPDLYEVYRTEPELAMVEVPGTTAADLALIDDDTNSAAELYREQVTQSPESATAWAGLALATRDPVLRDTPELVLAVHQEIRVRSGILTNPVRLARWLR